MANNTTYAFEAWIMRFENDEGPDGNGSPEGDIADDIRLARNAFPHYRGVETLFDLVALMKTAGAFQRAPGLALRAAEHAWQDFLDTCTPQEQMALRQRDLVLRQTYAEVDEPTDRIAAA